MSLFQFVYEKYFNVHYETDIFKIDRVKATYMQKRVWRYLVMIKYYLKRDNKAKQ